jgi:PAS domain S-box-containing protein
VLNRNFSHDPWRAISIAVVAPALRDGRTIAQRETASTRANGHSSIVSHSALFAWAKTQPQPRHAIIHIRAVAFENHLLHPGVGVSFGQLQIYNQKKRLKAALQPAPVLCLFMVAVLWAVLTVVLMAERQRTLEAAVQQGSNLVRLFQQNTAAMFKSVDRTLLLLRDKYEDDPGHFDIGDLLKQSVALDNMTAQFAIADQHGDARALIAADGVVSTAYFGDRNYFQQQRDAADDRLLVSGPLLSKISHKSLLILSRKLRNADGSFAGIVGGAIDPTFIGKFYQSVDIGAAGNVVLRDLDGVILASAGTVVPTTGRQVLPPTLRNAVAKSPSGYIRGWGAVDGVKRLVFYQKSDDLPVIMTVGLAERDVFAGYRRTWLISVWSAIFLTALLVLGMVMSIRHQLRLNQSLAARLTVERNLENAKTFLDTIIEHLPLPIVVKDPETLQHQLVNRAFEAFFGLPREQIIGKTVYDILPPEEAEQIVQSDREASHSEDRPVNSEFTLHTRTNGVRTVMATRLAVRDKDGALSHLIAMFEDVTDRREFDNRIMYMAHHDALTGLANRAAVAQKIEDAAARQRRWGHTSSRLSPSRSTSRATRSTSARRSVFRSPPSTPAIPRTC